MSEIRRDLTMLEMSLLKDMENIEKKLVNKIKKIKYNVEIENFNFTYNKFIETMKNIKMETEEMNNKIEKVLMIKKQETGYNTFKYLQEFE